MISSDNALIRELWKEDRDAPLTELFLLGPIVVLLVASFIVNRQRRGILTTFGVEHALGADSPVSSLYS